MKEYKKLDGMKFEEVNYIQYFEFEDGHIARQINVNFLREGVTFMDINNREDWDWMTDAPLAKFDQTLLESITPTEFTELWDTRNG
jgi:hypothetical protein